MLLAVFLGSIADISGRQKSFLSFFMCVGVAGTGALGLVAAGEWEMALFVYMFATLAFMLSNVFYDALLVEVSAPEERERVSALGFALGYLGGGILFVFASAAVFYAEKFGLEGQHITMRVSFYVTAIWWLLFSIPLIYFIRIPQTAIQIKLGFKRFKSTLQLIPANKSVMWFLIAYWLYIDGVDTIIRMAVDYGKVLGFSSTSLLLALLVVQFVGFPATLLYGIFAEKVGARLSIFVAIGIYIFICILGASIQSTAGFYMLAVLIGLAQGGIQSQSRSLFSQLIPAERAGQFFGVYNFLGRFAAVVGPLLLGWVGVLTQSPRLGILSLVVLFIAGGLILLKVPAHRNQEKDSVSNV